MADMPRILEIAGRNGLVVVEDACQSLGSSINGKGAGSWGLTGCWSFYPFKMLGGYGDGGAITTDDPQVALWATRMRYNGEERNTGEYHGHGFTCLLDNLQAAFLDVKLKRLPEVDKEEKESPGATEERSQDAGMVLRTTTDRGSTCIQNYTVRSAHGSEFSSTSRETGSRCSRSSESRTTGTRL
jgi:dTDP-4-amino-4,6-dideoxygalactose transaminase